MRTEMERVDGFTQVELRVVIVIISILAGFLLPVLAKDCESARGMACASTYRHIGLLVHPFADENHGRYFGNSYGTWGSTQNPPSTWSGTFVTPAFGKVVIRGSGKPLALNCHGVAHHVLYLDADIKLEKPANELNEMNRWRW